MQQAEQSDNLRVVTCVSAQNGGLFISRGRGKHPSRVIQSHELILVTQGTLSITESGTAFNLRPGETLVLFPNRLHEGFAPYPTDLRYYWVHFTQYAGLAASGRFGLSVPQHTQVPDAARLVETFRWFLDEQERGALSETRRDLLVTLMLETVASGSRVRGGPGGTSAQDLLAESAGRIIKVRYAQPISTSDIATELCCNPDYLGRVYRRRFGRSIVHDVHYRRIKYAKTLLLQETLTVKEVSFAVGYRNSSYFRRKFREYEDLSPTDFRALYSQLHVNTE